MSSWLAFSDHADTLRRRAIEYKARGEMEIYALTLAESRALTERYLKQSPAPGAPGFARLEP